MANRTCQSGQTSSVEEPAESKTGVDPPLEMLFYSQTGHPKDEEFSHPVGKWTPKIFASYKTSRQGLQAKSWGTDVRSLEPNEKTDGR